MANILTAEMVRINMGPDLVDTNTYKVTYEDGSIKYVPMDDDNTDYQKYLEMLANH